ncbi:MAG: hypothetical protein JWQ09_1488 [Segetibacter sp.]|nr:hypothetical protein [Segetibacter sp.]
MNAIFTGIIVVLLMTACKEQKNKTAKTADIGVAANETEKNIYRSGDSMLAAFKRKDWMTFVKYNHPNMTKRMGGAEAFASFINVQMKQIPDSAIKSISLVKILQVVKTPKDEQCVVAQNMKMELKGISLDKTTYLVGESLDNGNTWTFFDASTKTGLTPKDIKPDISTELKIPLVKNDVQK